MTKRNKDAITTMAADKATGASGDVAAARADESLVRARAQSKKANRPYLMRQRFMKFASGFVRYALLTALAYLILFPILSMISTTFKSPSELGSPVSIWLPSDPSVEHLVMAFRNLRYEKTLPYTLLSVALQVVLQMLSALLAGYAFARLKFPGRRLLFGCVILTIIVPPQAISLTQYLNFRFFDVFGIAKATTGESLNLLTSPIGLYLLAATGQGLKSGLFIYIFRQGFRNLPKELEESAFIDGSGYLRTFFRIVVPNSRSSMLTVGVLSFVWNWNDMYFVNLFGGNSNHMMVRYNAVASSGSAMEESIQATARALGSLGGNFELLIKNPLYQQAISDSMSLLMILPLVILYLFIQRRFVASVERAGIVG